MARGPSFEWRGGLVSNGAAAWFRMGGGAGFEWGAGLVSNGNCGGLFSNGGGRGWFRMETAGAWFRMVVSAVSKVSGLLLNIVSEWRRCPSGSAPRPHLTKYIFVAGPYPVGGEQSCDYRGLS